VKRVSYGWAEPGASILFQFLAGDEAAADLELGVGQAHRLAGDGDGDAGDLEHHGAGLDDGDVVLHGALAGAHSHFGRLLGHRGVREDAHPHLALALEGAGDGDAGGFDLVGGDAGAVQGLDAEITEVEGVAGGRVAADLALAVLAPLGASGLEIGHGERVLEGWGGGLRTRSPWRRSST